MNRFIVLFCLLYFNYVANFIEAYGRMYYNYFKIFMIINLWLVERDDCS